MTESEKYTRMVANIFDKIGIDDEYTLEGIGKNVDLWLNNKEPLFDILRKHPHWNEEAKAIILKNTEYRSADIEQRAEDMRTLLRYYSNTNETTNAILMSICYGADKFLSEEYATDIKVGLGIDCTAGQKTSRIIKKILQSIGYGSNDITSYSILSVEDNTKQKLDDFHHGEERLYAKIADSFNPLKVEKISILSANICDFLLMSNGNSWSSCHFINSSGAYSGCYKGGTLSYANDATTLIYYTIDKNYNGKEFWMQPKINRQLFMYNGQGVLLQSRLYPDYKNTDLSKQYRELVQSIIAECETFPNLWQTRKYRNGLWNFFETFADALHYTDYNYIDYNCKISFAGEIEEHQNDDVVEIGGISCCVHCGEMRSYYEDGDQKSRLVCDECELVECDECGELHPRYEMIVTDDNYYCSDCVIECDECGADILESDCYRVIDRYENVVLVCENCFNQYYVWSERENDYIHTDIAVWIQDENDYWLRKEVKDLLQSGKMYEDGYGNICWATEEVTA